MGGIEYVCLYQGYRMCMCTDMSQCICECILHFIYNMVCVYTIYITCKYSFILSQCTPPHALVKQSIRPNRAANHRGQL